MVRNGKLVESETYSSLDLVDFPGLPCETQRSSPSDHELEMNFLFTLEFKLLVTTEVFAKYRSQLDMEGAAAEE
ncbi:hypothetical protein WN944_007524 [Citrus x changshan-huyou]|uniref:Uncharacterized protein n=1 Tax=Citrus x changshan-huyou TaxID=2935761 RepID=A0AAP0QUZ5_9ROSI